jgi:small multidrug resistance pump
MPDNDDTEGLMSQWYFLLFAIIAEVIATSSLKASEGFTKLTPSVIVVFGYAIAFYFLSRTLTSIPIGVAYAIWSGLGVALISLIGWIWFGDRIDVAGWVGVFLITIGVVIIKFFSKSIAN